MDTLILSFVSLVLMSELEQSTATSQMSPIEREEAFLKDTNQDIGWVKTEHGHKIMLAFVKQFAPSYYTKLSTLKDQETTELVGFTFKFYAPKKPEDPLWIYRFPKKSGGGSSGGQRFTPKRVVDIYEGSFPETQMFLNQRANENWEYANSFIRSDDVVIYILIKKGAYAPSS